ncbi:hypothetical protein AAG570_010232 [Ranatra chinensis]|uniref:Major facilitator superfamily (MFS) profile domain-containing protein n=1 Tax=Ranatra chinensis TaxID=642074 RepID=A0ABD0YLY0_9HEMI
MASKRRNMFHKNKTQETTENGRYNSVMLWFPDTVNQMSAYAGNHPAYGVTLCQVLAHGSEPIIEGGEQPVFWNNATRETFLMANGSRYAYNTEDSSETEACVAQVDAVTFVSNITVGILQLTAFLATNPVVAIFGRKIVLGCLLLIPGVCCFLIANVADIMYLSIALMTSLAVLISSTVPIILSIIVDLFPTNIRSMATSVAMICGRLGAAAGGQIFGIYQQTHCTAAFNTVGVVLICIAGVVVSTVPNERKPA